MVGAVNDHIVPWTTSYQATRLLGGTVRYVLSNGGHVAGHRQSARAQGLVHGQPRRRRPILAVPAGPSSWSAAADTGDGSGGRTGPWAGPRAEKSGRPTPPQLGSRRYPVLSDAPGQYVHG